MKNINDLLKKEDVLVVDVRSAWEHNEGHVKNALNIPLDEIPGRLNEFRKRKGPFILYCRSGHRSGMAANILRQAGVTNVVNGGSIIDMQKITLN